MSMHNRVHNQTPHFQHYRAVAAFPFQIEIKMSDVAILAWALIFCMASTWAAVPMPSGSFLGYFTNEEMESYLEVLHRRRPMFVAEPLVIGKSYVRIEAYLFKKIIIFKPRFNHPCMHPFTYAPIHTCIYPPSHTLAPPP